MLGNPYCFSCNSEILKKLQIYIYIYIHIYIYTYIHTYIHTYHIVARTMRVRSGVVGSDWAASIPDGFIGFLFDLGLNSPAALWSCGRPNL